MTDPPPIWRRRPGADGLVPATPVPAVDLGDNLWSSAGLSNSYLMRTDDGRIVVNCGMAFEAEVHRPAFDAVDDAPIHTVILTQGHPDHFGGVNRFLDEGTQLVTHANFQQFLTDFEKLTDYRTRNSAFAFNHVYDAIARYVETHGGRFPAQSSPTPTLQFEDRLELDIGGVHLELLATRGGETTDSLVIWIPETGTVLTGNMLGPLFGHVPNLVTIRGDRYRDALDYVASIETVRALGAARLVTGHFDPIEGSDVIDRELTRMRDAAQWVHDRVIDGMNAGVDVHTLMRETVLPPELEVGQGYGKVAWNVRAIWETYAGWFHHQSTTELYGVPASEVAGDIVEAAGASALVAAARARLAAGEPQAAIHLTDLVLSADPVCSEARAAALDAHHVLLEAADNFWERAWLRRQIAKLGEPA
ncbi:MAG: MBL fold metallo-hydrolase [Acidimicrobiia bacterium]|nr:MBL fold metallo-hydrolase [Acidimicrobiia bacterium]